MERTVRSLAKELAGNFYEQNRTPKFRTAFPTFKHYMRGQWVQPDGSIKMYRPGWLHHVEMARKMLALMLGQPDSKISPAMKERIFDALIEDRQKQFAAEQNKSARSLFQVGMRADG
ncbi:MAG TPA: hypothetical protein VFX37_10550 [Pseudolabrys sp.]|nr:hypothetical protein [Pseudolabrys sp.]